MLINVEKYMLIKFRDKGRDFSGCDCRGLVGLILKDKFGIDIPDANVSCMNKSEVNLKIESNKEFWKKVDNPGWPCIILFATTEPDEIDHMGLYIGDGDFIHTSFRTKYPRINSIEDPYWKSLIEGFYVRK